MERTKPGIEDDEPQLGVERPGDGDDPLRQFRRKHKGLLPESWRVKLPVFEGPLDLLLHLVRINEVEITDIPVALICDQYHEYLELMDELDLDIAGEYIYEAAILIQLKSRMLLPQPRVEEGEPAPEDPRQELVNRLLEYQRIREAAERMAEISTVRLGLWTRQPQDLPNADDAEIDVGDLSLFDLLRVFKGVLERFDREHPSALVLGREVYSVREQIDRLLQRVRAGYPFDLVDDLLSLSCRGEAIAAFLAVLELVRLGAFRLQASADGTITMIRTARELLPAELEAIGG